MRLDDYIQYLIVSVIIISGAAHLSAQISYYQENDSVLTAQTHLMGSSFVITLVEKDQDKARTSIEEAIGEMERIENLISSWKDSSVTSDLKRFAGQKPIIVPVEYFNLVKRGMKLSLLLDGAFDLTYSALGGIWHFNQQDTKWPDTSQLKERLSLVGWDRVELNEQTWEIYLPMEGMQLGFGGIGKGYAADKAVELLKAKNISAGVVNAGGDLKCWGNSPGSIGWEVSIANPNEVNIPFTAFDIKDLAVVTSGNYENYVMIDGVRYSHILDPRTGIPVHGVSSVTVVSPSAELADGLATGLFVIGPEKGIELVNKMKQTECIYIMEDGNVFSSDNFVFYEK